LAKFAKYKPLPDENDKSMKNAYAFIEKTKLIEKVTDIKEDTNNNMTKVEKKDE